jgi:hypothetical protein
MPLFFYQQTRTLPFVKLFSLAAGLVAYTVLIPIWGLAGVCLSVVVIKVVEAFGARAATLLTGTDSVGVYSLNRLHVLVVATLFLLLLPIIKTDLPLSLGAYYGVISGLMLIPAVIGGLRLMRAQLPKVMLR